MKRTLTGQLFLRILPALLGMLLLIGALAFYSCRREINYVYDMQMVNDAKVLWNLVEDELKEEGYRSIKQLGHSDTAGMAIWDGEADDYGTARMFRIWRGESKLLMVSDTALPATISRQNPGFSIVQYQGETWRIYTMPIGQSGIAMELGEKMSLRNGLILNILIDLSVPLLLAVPFFGLGLWSGIRRGLGTIRELVQQIHTRNSDDLSPIDAKQLPLDLAPLGRSINRLFTKLAQSISAERHFADHAAHQLRTPLAGTRLLIQTLADADSEAEREAILNDLADSNRRATDMVNKLLVAARISHQPLICQPVTLYPVVARAMAEMAPMAAEKSLRIHLEGDERIQVMADEGLLGLLVTNTVENAIKYTPSLGSVMVSIGDHATGCCLRVMDTGPGIASHERELVFRRFYRIEGSEGTGTGLGLAIASDIVERFGGTIELTEGPGAKGLCVEIYLPTPVSA